MTNERLYNIKLGPNHTVPITTEDITEVDLDEEEIYLDDIRLTEARAQEIAREISRRYGKQGGRPTLPDSERASVQKAVRLTPAKAEQLSQVAAARGMRESDVIRAALDAYLAS